MNKFIFMPTRVLILITVLASALVSATAETGYLSIQVVDLYESPVAGIRITIEGSGGSAVSGSDGKARIRLSAGTAEGVGVTLTMTSLDRAQSYSMLQPYDHRARVPPFADVPDNFVKIIVVKKGDSAITANHLFINIVASNIAQSRSSSDRPSPRPIVTIKSIAKQFGLAEDLIEQAIAEAAQQATDPYARGVAQMAQGQFLDAIPNLEESLNRRKSREHKVSEAVFESAKQLALANSVLGRHHATIDACKEALRIHPEDAGLLETEGMAYANIRQFQDAAPLLAKALVDYKTQNPANASFLGAYQDNLAGILVEVGDYDAANKLAEDTRQLYLAKYGSASLQMSSNLIIRALISVGEANRLTRGDSVFLTPGTATSAPRVTRTIMMADALDASKKMRNAEALSVEAIQIRVKELPKDDPRIADARDWLASVLISAGDDIGAMQCLDAAIRTWRLYLPATAHSLASSLTERATVEAGQEQYKESSATIGEANKVFKLHAGSNDLLFAHMLTDKIINLARGGRALESIPLLQAVYQINKTQGGTDDPYTKDTLAQLQSLNPQKDIMMHTLQPSYRSKSRPPQAVDLTLLCPVSLTAQ